MRRLGVALVALASGVAAAALAGPLFAGSIRYHVSEDVLNQVMGSDAVALFLVAPVCLLAAVLAFRRHPAAPLLAIGPAGFAAYTYAQLAMGGEFATQPGNSERYFLLFLTLFVLGAFIVVSAWNLTGDLPELPLRRTIATVVILLAGFLAFGLHLPGLVDVMSGSPEDIGYLQGPTVFWVVKLMDLGIVVPIAAAVGVGLLRRSAWAQRASYAVLGWGAMLGSAVFGMAVVMQVNDDPAAEFANVVVFGVFALAFLALDLRALWPLFGPSRGPEPEESAFVTAWQRHLEMGQDSHSRDASLR